MKSKLLLIFILTCILALWGHQTYQAQLADEREQNLQQQLAHINLSGVDLATIINTVDEVGAYEVQLNWKEVLTLLAINQDNQLYNLTENMIETTAKRFINGSDVKSLNDLLTHTLYTDEERRRADQYMIDLQYVGYTPDKLLPTSKESMFIKQLIEPAKINYTKTGILPSITIAQAILESNWGQSELSREGHNLFGIKADDSWEGNRGTYTTVEYQNESIDGEFRQYDTWLASIEDHANFLLNNKRYAEVGVFDAKTYRVQAKAIESGGYSTAVDEIGNLVYAKRLGELIRQYNLQIFDHEVMHD